MLLPSMQQQTNTFLGGWGRTLLKIYNIYIYNILYVQHKGWSTVAWYNGVRDGRLIHPGLDFMVPSLYHVYVNCLNCIHLVIFIRVGIIYILSLAIGHYFRRGSILWCNSVGKLKKAIRFRIVDNIYMYIYYM